MELGLGWLGVQVPELPLAVQGEWGLVKRYFRFGTGLEKWGRIKGLSSLLPSFSDISHSICRRVVREMLGGSRALSWQSERHALRVGVLGLRDRNAIPEEEPQTCLNSSPFLSLLMNYLRVLVFSSCPSSLPSILPWMGEGCVWWILISKAPGLFMSHSQVAVLLFRMQSGTPFGYLFLYIL